MKLARVGPLTALCALVLATPSAAAADSIGVSVDGTHWSATLPAPLFDPAIRWVPGDSREATFYIRNQASTEALATVTLAVDGALSDSGDLTVAGRGESTDWQLARGSGSHELVSAVPLGVGESMPVTVRITLEAEARNSSQAQSLEFTVVVTFEAADTQPETSTTSTTTPPTGGVDTTERPAGLPPAPTMTHPLPSSGALGTIPLAAAAAALTAVGAAAVAGSRRRRPDPTEGQTHA